MTALLLRRFLTESARHPVTVAMLVVVPIVFVVVSADAMADASVLLGGESGPRTETATAGWSAGFVAALAMYFQMRSARAADRRLALAGLGPRSLVAARMATGLTLALVTSIAALVTLAVSNGLDDPIRVVVGTLMFAVIYLAVGSLVGVLVANPVNGTVLILFVWLVDVIFGPVFQTADYALSRVFPTHFVTLWTVDVPSDHGGAPGDVGWALVWTVAALAVSWAVAALASRPARAGRRTGGGQLLTGVRSGLREAGRNRVLWVLLVAVPAVYVALAVPITPREYQTMRMSEAGSDVAVRFWFPDVHPGLMAPIAIGSLAALIGLFTIISARSADRRLVLAGFRQASLLGSRLAVIGMLAALATVTSLAVTAIWFDPERWALFALANLLVALTYALVGVVIGALFGRVGGVLVAFLVPFVDLGIEQSPMLSPEVSGWAHLLPGYGASQVLYDAALTPTFDETGALLLGLAWLVGLTAVVTILLRAPGGATSVSAASRAPLGLGDGRR